MKHSRGWYVLMITTSVLAPTALVVVAWSIHDHWSTLIAGTVLVMAAVSALLFGQQRTADAHAAQRAAACVELEDRVVERVVVRMRDERAVAVDMIAMRRDTVPMVPARDAVPPIPATPVGAVPSPNGTRPRDVLPEHIYWPLYTDITHDVLSDNDPDSGGAPAVQ